eukprot:COSAG05_NODE_13431_length_430_cov_1.404834_1_plen_63_part_01
MPGNENANRLALHALQATVVAVSYEGVAPGEDPMIAVQVRCRCRHALIAGIFCTVLLFPSRLD